MGWRFRRSIKILPGIRLNVSRSGVSASVGVRGAHATIGHGEVRENVGLPSTGISYTHVERTDQKASSEAQAAEGGEISPKGRAWRGWLWVLLFLAVGGSLACNIARSDEPAPANLNPYYIEPAPPDHRGTDEQPLVVGKAANELAAERADRAEHSRNERWSTVASIVLSLVTILLFGANVWLIRDSRAVSDRQEKDTQDALREQARAANEMHAVAEATKNNAVLMSGMIAKQMRAYISVEIGSAIYQDPNYVFEAQPVLTNNGLTPARNVCFKILTGIYSGKTLLDGIDHLPPVGDLLVNDAGLAPRQSFMIRGILGHRLPDADVPALMLGNEQRLFAWGKVTYDDVYGGSWHTNFCVNYSFVKVADKVIPRGSYFQKHNDAS